MFEADPTDEGETYPLDGDQIDLEPMVRDAVLLELPLGPLCGDDCAGARRLPAGTRRLRAEATTRGDRDAATRPPSATVEVRRATTAGATAALA